MNSTSWDQVKSTYKLGQFVQGKVGFHTPFGVFVNIDESLVKGLIKIVLVDQAIALFPQSSDRSYCRVKF